MYQESVEKVLQEGEQSSFSVCQGVEKTVEGRAQGAT